MHSISENKLIKELSLLVICTLALSCAWFTHFPLCHNFCWHPVLALFTACLEHSQLLSFSTAPNEDKSSRIQPPTEAQKPALHHIVSRLQTKSLLLWDSGANVGVQERSTADLSVVTWKGNNGGQLNECMDSVSWSLNEQWIIIYSGKYRIIQFWISAHFTGMVSLKLHRFSFFLQANSLLTEVKSTWYPLLCWDVSQLTVKHAHAAFGEANWA